MNSHAGRRVAIRGTGAIGMRHARVLASLGVQVILVPEREDRVDELRVAGFEAASAVPSDVDGTIICTRTGLHRQSASQSTGCLLIEKPVGVDFLDGERLLADAQANGQSVHVAYCLRFNPGVRFLAEKITHIGSVESVDVECYSWLPNWRPGRDYRQVYSSASGEGGVMLDLSHEIDLVCHLLGAGKCELARIEASRVLELQPGVDESALLVTSHGPTVATIRLSFSRRVESRRMRVYGTEGTLEWDAVARVASLVDADGALVDGVKWEDPNTMYRDQAEAWLRVLQGEDQGVLATGAEALETMKIIDAARGWSEVRG